MLLSSANAPPARHELRTVRAHRDLLTHVDLSKSEET